MSSTSRFAFRASAAVAVLPLLLSSCVLAEYLLGIRDGCTEWTRTVDFAASSEILGGTWQGTVADYPTEGADATLTLALTATYGDEEHYAVAGTFALGTDEALTLTGTVDGRCSERYRAGGATSGAPTRQEGDVVAPASAPPPAGLEAEVRDAEGVLVWEARASWGGVAGGPGLGSGSFLLFLESGVADDDGRPAWRDVAMSRVDSP